jgi:hypothetical protein
MLLWWDGSVAMAMAFLLCSRSADKVFEEFLIFARRCLCLAKSFPVLDELYCFRREDFVRFLNGFCVATVASVVGGGKSWLFSINFMV